MKDLYVNNAFSALLEEKLQCKKNIVQVLSQMLNMDKKSIYRRLNNEVFFTFSEICKVSSELDLSIDKFIRIHFLEIPHNGSVESLPGNQDIQSLIQIISKTKDYVAEIAQEPDVELGNLTNLFPVIFRLQNKWLFSLYEFFLNFQSGYKKTFAEFHNEERMQILVDSFYDLFKLFGEAKQYDFVLGRNPMRLLMENAVYLKNIRLLTLDEYNRFKQEVAGFTEKLEYLTEADRPHEDGKKYNIYLSEMNFNTNCLYLWSDKRSFSFMQMYVLGIHYSHDNDHNIKMKKWLDQLKNNSVLITGSSLDKRILFFEEQHKVLKEF